METVVRKLIQYCLVTLDGVFEDPVAWGYREYNEDAHFRDGLGQVLACDAMLWGRRNYEISKPIFGARTDAWAARINAMKKYVFSSTLQTVDWDNTTIIRGDAGNEVAKLKEQEGGDLLIYGHTLLAEALWKHNLIDVLDIAVHPVIAGRGKTFFREGLNAKLKLIAAKSYSKGRVKLTYEPQRP
jgi:dihydrofolate reductase